MTMQAVEKQGIHLLETYTSFVRRGKTYTEYLTDNYWSCEYLIGKLRFAYKIVATTQTVAKTKGFEKVKKALARLGVENGCVFCFCEQITIVAVLSV